MANQPAGFQFAKPYDPTNPVSSDMRYGKFNGATTTPFTSKTEALELIKSALRYQGLQCVITNGSSISLYWFRGGVADNDLVLLQTDVDVTGKEDSVNKTTVIRDISTANNTNYPSELAVRVLADAVKNDIKGEVSEQYDTLKKIADTLIGFGKQKIFDNLQQRNAYPVSSLPFQAFVIDNGDGKFALYQAITTGANATYVLISDPDLLNATMSAPQIKIAYESNTNTNAFTNSLKTKLDSIIKAFTLSFTQPVREYKDYFENSVTITSIIGDGTFILRYSINGGTTYTTLNLPYTGNLTIPAGWIRWRIDYANQTTGIASVYIKLL